MNNLKFFNRKAFNTINLIVIVMGSSTSGLGQVPNPLSMSHLASEMRVLAKTQTCDQAYKVSLKNLITPYFVVNPGEDIVVKINSSGNIPLQFYIHACGCPGPTTPNRGFTSDYTTLYDNANSKTLLDGARINEPLSNGAVSTITEGLALFLIERAKQELALALFDRFEKQVNDNTYLKYFLPATQDVLTLIGTDIYRFEAFLQGLKVSFTTDLYALPNNLSNYLLNNPDKVPELSRYRELLIDALHVTQSITQGTDLLQEITFLAKDGAMKNSSEPGIQNIHAYVQTVHILISALFDRYGKFIPIEFIAEVRRDTTLKNAYVGLLVQAGSQVDIPTIGKLSVVIMQNTNVIDEIANLLSLIEELKKSIEDQDVLAAQDKESYESYYMIFKSFISVLDFGYHFYNNSSLRSSTGTIERPLFFDLSESLALITLQIRQKKYSAAAISVALVFDKIIPAGNNEGRKKLSVAFKYLSFIAALAEAQDGAQVAAVIESFALPPGSSATKRKSSFTLALNGGLGGAYGGEKVPGIDQEREGYLGVTAPVGINFGFGIRNKYVTQFSLGIDIIDIGAVTAYRLNSDNDAIATLPEFTLQNIFSPGVYAEIGLFNSPIAVGIGYHFGPNLREITKAGQAITSPAGGNRISASFKVDIPLTYFVATPMKVTGKVKT